MSAKDLKKRARKLDVILKPIPTALLRTAKYRPDNPMGCDLSERKKGRRAKPFQQRHYSQNYYLQLIQKVVEKRAQGAQGAQGAQSTLCGPNVDEYLNEVMCLYLSDLTRGVCALRLVPPTIASNRTNNYEVLGVAFYHPTNSTTKFIRVRRPRTAAERNARYGNWAPQYLRGKSYYEALSDAPLQWTGVYNTLAANAPLQTSVAARMNDESYAELDLLCRSALLVPSLKGVGELLLYYALFDLWRQRKGGRQRFDGVVLSTASMLSANDLLRGSGRRRMLPQEVRKLLVREMNGQVPGGAALGKFYSKYGFKRARAVHRGTDYDYWAHTAAVAPEYYMVLRGAEWNAIPQKIAALAQKAAPNPPIPFGLRMGAELRNTLCRKGERGEVGGGPNVLPPVFTDEWNKRRNVRNLQKWQASLGGRGGGCLF